MSWRIFPTIVSNISILTTHHLILIVLRTHFSTWIHFFFSKNFTTNTITCKNAIFWCEFYIFICKNDNFIVLNKLLLKNQNVSEIVNAFIVKNNKHFLKLKEYFKRNALIYQRIYTSFCRVDDYDVKSKLAFNIASGGYKNQQENIHFIREMPIKQEVVKTSNVVEMYSPPPPTSTLEVEKTKWKLKKCKCDVVGKIGLKKKKEGNTRLLSELKTTDLYMKCINSNVC